MRHTGFLCAGLLCLFSCNPRQEERPHAQEERSAPGVAREIGAISTLTDTAEIGRLILRGNAIVREAPDSAAALYRQAVKLCGQIGYPEGRAMAYNNLSCCYLNKKDYPKANYYLLQLKAELSRIPGLFYNQRHSGHRKLLAQKYNYRAIACYEAGHYDSASVWYIHTINRIGHADTTTYHTLAAAYAGLGAISGRLFNRARALAYFDKAEALAGQYNDSGLLATTLSNKAVLFIEGKNYTAGRAAAQKAWDIMHRLHQAENTAHLAHTIALSLIRERQPEAALPYSKAALQTALQRQIAGEKITAYYGLGYNYVALGKYREAERYLQAGLQLALRKGERDNIANAYEQLAAAYEGLGQYAQALQYQKKYVAIRDSLLGKESAGRIAEVETRYQVAQKDRELAEKDKALLQTQLKIAGQRKQQYLWIGGTVICILVLLGLLYRKRYKAELHQLKATIAGEEKERTRLARELHDGIISRLSIIKMNFSALPQQYKDLHTAADFHDVVNQLEQSITELRTTSHNLLPEVLQQAGLAESLRSYCDRIRKIALLDIEFQVIGELPGLTDEFQLNIYRIIQELVNNIIKHSNAGHALVQFHVRSDQLTVTLDDDGSNMPEFPRNGRSGIGMQNLYDRVRLLNGTIEIEHNKGTSVYLEFNMKKFLRKT